MRILLVDDESLIRMDLRDQLEAAGHEIVGEGRNGVEAIALAKELEPEVILMDVKMPELDGIQAARQIRHHKLAPVVLLTAYSQQDLVQQAQESGVYGYLLKPVREEQVVPALQMAVGRFQDECRLRLDVSQLEGQLEERKLVARATGILMDVYQLTEEEAFKRIRTFSMEKGKKISEICQAVIAGYEKRKKDKG